MATEDRSTIDLLRGSRITAYGIGLVSLLAGLFLLFWPERTEHVVGVILGVLFLVSGFAQSAEAITTHRKGSAWGFLLLRGVINIGFGLVLIFWTGAVSTTIVRLIGLDFVLTGVLALIASLMIDKEMGRGSLIIHGLLSIGVGIAVMAWPNSIKYAAAILIAIVLILIGLLMLGTGYQLSKASKAMA
jgi:uncharacterized membrane protein HdeD (DUF308 family)